VTARRAVAWTALLAALLAARAQAAPLRLPPVVKAKLANGLRVFVVATNRVPIVDLRLVVRAGSVDDPPGKDGLAALTADLLDQGAGARDARQLADDIAFVGGSLEADADLERTVVTCEVLKKDFGTGLELLRDVVVSPRFPDAEVARKRDAALAEIASRTNDPAVVADVALGPFLLGQSRLAHPAQGYEASVKSLTREDVVGFHARWFRPDNAMLAVVGDVDPKTVVAALERAFASWPAVGPAPAATPRYDPVPQIRGRRIEIVDKPEVTQAQVRIGCIGVPRNHPDRFPILVANAILGGGFTSRLVSEVRVRQALTYDIDSGFDMDRDAGTYDITTSTRVESTRKLIDAALAEVRRLSEQGPSEQELASAIQYLTGQYPMDLQAPGDLAERLLDIEFYGLGADDLETFPDRVRAVTMTDVRRALKSYFCIDDLRIVVVADPAAVRAQLESLGPVEVARPQ
jgi:zinc protease